MGSSRRRDQWSKRVFETLARPWVRRQKLDLAAFVALDPARILVVRQHDQLGDMVCAIPALRALRRRYPRARVLLVTGPVHDAVVRHHPDVDGVLLYDKRATRLSPLATLRFLRALRGFGADLAFVLNTVSFSSTSAWIAALSGARVLVGGDSVPFGWTTSRWLYSLEMASVPGSAEHAIDQGLSALASIGITAGSRTVSLVPGPAAEVRAAEFLAAFAAAPAIAAVHPGAGKAENRWPPDRFARAIEALEAWGAQVFLIEGPVDAGAVRTTCAALGSERPVLREVDAAVVAAVVARCQVALVNDTGIMHIAAAMGTPTVALFGPTASARWAPPSCDSVALQSPDASMQGISLEVVLANLRERLQRGRRLRPR